MTTKSIDWFVASCLADAGYAETPLGSNKTKFGKLFGWIGVAWCAIYGWCKYRAAGVVLPIKSASCVAIYDYCVAHGLHYDSTHCVPGDSVIRTWQRLSRNARGFDAEQTHYQEVLKTKVVNGRKWLGLWGGNQGAGVVGPALEWIEAGDSSILGGLAFHRLFEPVATRTVPAPAAVEPTVNKHADVKSLPAAKSHKYPKVGEPGTAEAVNLGKRVKGKRIVGAKRRAAFRRTANRILNALKHK